MELPPFMTPVMEELVRPPSDAPVKREAEGAEPQPDGTGEKQEQEQELPEGSAEKAMRTTEAEAGHGDAGRGRPADAPREDEDGPAGAADGRTHDADGGGSDSPEQSGLGDVPQEEADAREEDLGEQVFHYDEWDHKIEDYRPAWCTLTEHRQTRTQEGFVAATFHEFGGIVTQIRRNFQLMRPEALRKMRYQEDGDDLDTDGLVEYVVDRQRPRLPHPAGLHQARQARPRRHHRLPGRHVQLDRPQDRRPQADHRHREGSAPADVRGPRGDPRRVRHLRLLRLGPRGLRVLRRQGARGALRRPGQGPHRRHLRPPEDPDGAGDPPRHPPPRRRRLAT